MSKEYVFEFAGTKETLFEALNPYPYSVSFNGDKKVYYFDDYIIEVIGDTIRFGVERQGHSGGCWFVPEITEHDDSTELRGVISTHCNKVKYRKIEKIIDKTGEVLLTVLLFPVLLIYWACVLVKRLLRKLRGKPLPKEKTTEERLYDLMENRLGCVRKEKA